MSKKNDYNGSVKSGKPKILDSWSEMYKAWPMCTILIVANEFFQEITSLNSVLTLYLINGLRLSENQTYIYYNLYSVFGGLFPLVGSILADGYIGKFRTILFATMLYGLGKFLMTVVSTFPPDHYFHSWGDLIGIIIILFGMGGVTPCVTSFGGDQFEPCQTKMISVYFAMYSIAINAGNMISAAVYPILRTQSCMGQDSCFPLLFAVSTFFIIVSSILFILGSKYYKKQPPSGNIFGEIFSTTKIALKNRRNAKTGLQTSHWLDFYFDTHDCRKFVKCLALQNQRKDLSACERKLFIDEIKALYRIIVMYLPIPMFWALYNQQYSVWIVQSIQMDCRLWGNVYLLPDQMQFINPFLTLLFVVLFQSVVYPICSKFCILTPLRKMVAGGVVTSIAFFICALVQIQINKTLPELPESDFSFVSIINTFKKCDVNVSTTKTGIIDYRFVLSNTSLKNDKLNNRKELFELPSGHITFDFIYTGSGCDSVIANLPKSLSHELLQKSIYYIYVGQSGAFINKANHEKPMLGMGEFSLSINVAFADSLLTQDLALCRIENSSQILDGKHSCNQKKKKNFYFFNVSSALLKPYAKASEDSESFAVLFDLRPIRPGTWKLFYINQFDENQLDVTPTSIVVNNCAQGGVYVLMLTGSPEHPKQQILQVVPNNSVSILWQIPQIVVISMAEILFCVTGYEFSYSQSGKSMKSTVQALWFLTVAIGDLIIVFVALIDFQNLVMQFLIYAGAMLLVIFIFALLSIYYYEYRDNTDDDESVYNCGHEKKDMLLTPINCGSRNLLNN